jgi:hypothetical protein
VKEDLRILLDVAAHAPIKEEPKEPAEAVQGSYHHVHFHVVSVVEPKNQKTFK